MTIFKNKKIVDKKVTINGIPVYDAIIGEEGTGMTCISLVD